MKSKWVLVQYPLKQGKFVILYQNLEVFQQVLYTALSLCLPDI